MEQVSQWPNSTERLENLLSNDIFNLYFCVFHEVSFCPLILEKRFFSNELFLFDGQIEIISSQFTLIWMKMPKWETRSQKGGNVKKWIKMIQKLHFVFIWNSKLFSNDMKSSIQTFWFDFVEFNIFILNFIKNLFGMMSLKNKKVEQTEILFE